MASSLTMFLANFERDIASQEAVLAKVGPPALPFLPTLPTFAQGGRSPRLDVGWSPPPEGLARAAAWLTETLGDRLLGFNFWALDGLLKLPELFEVVAALEDPTPAAEPPPERVHFMDLSEAERWSLVQEGLSQLGILYEEGHLLTDIA